MRAFDLAFSKASSIQCGDHIFVVYCDASNIITPAYCPEDMKIMVQARVLDVRITSIATHRIDIHTDKGICRAVPKLQNLFFMKPQTVITVKPNEIETRGLFNKKIGYSDVEEVVLLFDDLKQITFSNKFDLNGNFDVYGKPEKFVEKVLISYSVVNGSSFPVVTVNEKAHTLIMIFDKVKSIVFNLSDAELENSARTFKIPSQFKKIKNSDDSLTF